MRYLSPDIIKVDDTQIEETLVKSEEFADLAASSLQTRTIRGAFVGGKPDGVLVFMGMI